MNATHEVRGAKGYTTPRRFGGFQIPVSLQSAAIRRYCDEHSLVFHHHSSENLSEDSYAVLSSIVEAADRLEAIVMCSASMLPRNAPLRSRLLADAIAQGCALHFIFENLVVASADDMRELEALLGLTALADFNTDRRRNLIDLAAMV